MRRLPRLTHREKRGLEAGKGKDIFLAFLTKVKMTSLRHNLFRLPVRKLPYRGCLAKRL